MAETWDEPSLERALDRTLKESKPCGNDGKPAFPEWEYHAAVDTSCFLPDAEEVRVIRQSFGDVAGFDPNDDTRKAFDRKFREVFERLGETRPALIEYRDADKKQDPNVRPFIPLRSSRLGELLEVRVKSRLTRCPMIQAFARKGLLKRVYERFAIVNRVECRKSCLRFQGNKVVPRMRAFSPDKEIVEVVECIEIQPGEPDALRAYFDQKFPTGLCHELSHVATQLLPELRREFIRIRFPDFKDDGDGPDAHFGKSALYDQLRKDSRDKNKAAELVFPARYSGDRNALSSINEYFANAVEVVTAHGVVQPFEAVSGKITRPEYDWIVRYLSTE